MELKASHKIMRDTMTVVEMIEAARAAPAWVTNRTYPPFTIDHRYDDFLRESGITAAQLQFVLDNNPSYSTVLLSVLKTQLALAA